jgi:hypothetical protein
MLKLIFLFFFLSFFLSFFLLSFFRFTQAMFLHSFTYLFVVPTRDYFVPSSLLKIFYSVITLNSLLDTLYFYYLLFQFLKRFRFLSGLLARLKWPCRRRFFIVMSSFLSIFSLSSFILAQMHQL